MASSGEPARRHSSASCAKAIDAGSAWTRRRSSSIRGLSAATLEFYVTVTVRVVVAVRPSVSVAVTRTV